MWRCCDRMDVIASFMIFVDISILFEFNEVSYQFSHSLRHLYFNSESSRRWETVSIHHFRIHGNLNGQPSDGKHHRRHQHMFSMVFYPKLQQTKHTHVALFLDIVNDEQRWMNWERRASAEMERYASNIHLNMMFVCKWNVIPSPTHRRTRHISMVSTRTHVLFDSGCTAVDDNEPMHTINQY